MILYYNIQCVFYSNGRSKKEGGAKKRVFRIENALSAVYILFMNANTIFILC